MSDQEPEVLTVEEVARLHLRVSERTVYRLIDRGELTAFKVGTQWRITRAALAHSHVLPPTRRGSSRRTRKGRPMTRIVALANQKGGVGKTTTALNLGAALAQRQQRVLLIDLDPQSNLTTALGLNPYQLERTAYDVLHNPQHGAAIAIQSVRAHLDLLPATLDMAAAEIELSSAVGRELLLRKALAPVRAQYDFILIDPPPSLGLFTLNALVAATEVVIPLQVEIFALQGIGRLQKTVDLVHDLNPVLRIGGVLCTMVDQRTALSTGIEEQARALFGDLVYQTVIPQNVRLAESPGLGKTIFEYAPTSTGAQAYAALAEEVTRGK